VSTIFKNSKPVCEEIVVSN